jgi:TRAP-type C4-dicarboxylate transport system permease small subunit
VDRLVRFLEETCGVVALGVMLAALVIQVVFRYLFTPLIWPFELSIYMYICLIYLGAALAARRDTHVAFDLLVGLLPSKARHLIDVGVRLVGAVLLLPLLVPGLRLMAKSHTIRSASLGIPWSFLILVSLVGMALFAAHLLAGAVRAWRAFARGAA